MINETETNQTNQHIKDNRKILDKIKRKDIFPNIYYWDNTLKQTMIDVNIEENLPDITSSLNSKIERLKKGYEIYKKGFLIKDENSSNEQQFELLHEYLQAVAFRYVLIKRRPFILLNIKYNQLNEFEIRCIFEYIIHDKMYTELSRQKDSIAFIKLGWWSLKDIIEKYKKRVELGMGDYDREETNKW